MSDSVLVHLPFISIGSTQNVYKDLCKVPTTELTQDSGIFVDKLTRQYKKCDNEYENEHVQYVIKDGENTINYLRYCPLSCVAGSVSSDFQVTQLRNNIFQYFSTSQIEVRSCFQYPIFNSRCSEFTYEGLVVLILESSDVVKINTKVFELYPTILNPISKNARKKAKRSIQQEVREIPKQDTIVYLHMVCYHNKQYVNTQQLRLCTISEKYNTQDLSSLYLYRY